MATSRTGAARSLIGLVTLNSYTMHLQHSSLLLVAYGFSNAVGLWILWAAFRRPGQARAALTLIFGWAAWINYTTCHQHPEAYLEFGRYAMGYNSFINGWFRDHIKGMVSTIAAGQGLIALAMVYRGQWVKAACIAAIVFLLAITPLGLGAAFPFPLILAFAAGRLLYQNMAWPLWSKHAYQG